MWNRDFILSQDHTTVCESSRCLACEPAAEVVIKAHLYPTIGQSQYGRTATLDVDSVVPSASGTPTWYPKRKKPVSQCVDDTLKITFEVEFRHFFKNILKCSHFPFMTCRAVLLSCSKFEHVWKICATSFLSFYSQSCCVCWTPLNLVSAFRVFNGSSTVAAQLDTTWRHRYWFSVNERTIRA